MNNVIRVDRLPPTLQTLFHVYQLDSTSLHVRAWLDKLAEIISREEDIGPEFDLLCETFTKLGCPPPRPEDFYV